MIASCLLIIELALFTIQGPTEQRYNICLTSPDIQTKFNIKCIKHRLFLSPYAVPDTFFMATNITCKSA